jgi:hypothetical protein
MGYGAKDSYIEEGTIERLLDRLKVCIMHIGSPEQSNVVCGWKRTTGKGGRAICAAKSRGVFPESRETGQQNVRRFLLKALTETGESKVNSRKTERFPESKKPKSLYPPPLMSVVCCYCCVLQVPEWW